MKNKCLVFLCILTVVCSSSSHGCSCSRQNPQLAYALADAVIAIEEQSILCISGESCKTPFYLPKKVFKGGLQKGKSVEIAPAKEWKAFVMCGPNLKSGVHLVFLIRVKGQLQWLSGCHGDTYEIPDLLKGVNNPKGDENALTSYFHKLISLPDHSPLITHENEAIFAAITLLRKQGKDISKHDLDSARAMKLKSSEWSVIVPLKKTAPIITAGGQLIVTLDRLDPSKGAVSFGE